MLIIIQKYSVVPKLNRIMPQFNANKNVINNLQIQGNNITKMQQQRDRTSSGF